MCAVFFVFGIPDEDQDKDEDGSIGGRHWQMTRSLYVLRHAKSSWSDPDVSDFERPLAGRGKKAARRMAVHLTRVLPLPELVLCSSATRAAQTLKPIAKLLGGSVEVRLEDGLYGASGTALLTRLRALPDEVVSVLLIGHNPGVQDLLIKLASNGDPARLDLVRAGFPTCALATLRVTSRWSELGPSTTSVEDLVTPNSLSH
jgi:phosphohistidine phosphatase